MADASETAKQPKTAKPKTSATSARRAKRAPELEDDGGLRSRIARRAYEISQSAGAGDDEENWLRAERELSGKP
jgi:hypothetical protein